MATLLETVFGGLTDRFNNKVKPTSDINTFGEKQIITAASKEELMDKSLELQQQFYLLNQETSLAKQTELQYVQAQAMRLPAYVEYMMMESYPIITQALNLLAEHTTTINEKGKMLNIYSNNKTLKEDLEYLFYDVIDINTMLPFWARNLCKYGDNFVYLSTHKDRGVTGVRQLPTSEIERKETIKDNVATTKFTWQTGGQEFNTWQIAHFRLLGDEKWLPYGSSSLSGVRIYYRLLKMAEDSMMITKLTTNTRVKVVKINVGNAEVNDIPSIVQQTIAKFKKSPLIDPQTGNINYKYSMQTGIEDIFYPVRNMNEGSPIDIIEPLTAYDTSDIEYLRDNLLTGLGIPKAMLNFGDGAGEGGGITPQMDIMFSRKIMRIQNAIVQELNKIAIIHLHLLGYNENDIRDFKLTMNNPSHQADILRTELLLQKIDLYQKLTTPGDNGIPAYSQTKAKQEIFNMSNDEIIEDVKRVFIESLVGDQIKNVGLLYRRSNLFNDVEAYIKQGVFDPNLVGYDANQQQQGQTPEQGGEVPMGEPSLEAPQPETPAEPTNLQEKFTYRAGKLNDELKDLLKELSND